MENKEKIMVGDYVEPDFNYFKDFKSEDLTTEDLYGFVIDKNKDLITIEGIGSQKVSVWKESYFKKSELPDFYKEKGINRTRK